jgi:hypothetical protein
MALFADRIYYNAGGDVLRVDTLTMEATSNTLCTGIATRTYHRTVKPLVIAGSVSDRVVGSIDIVTTASSKDSSADILWIEWTSPAVRCGMSDLPGVGDTV